jgi:hypothetical protein
MDKAYTAECGGCKVGQACDDGEVKGNVTASMIVGKPLGRDMGYHASHMGPRPRRVLARALQHRMDQGCLQPTGTRVPGQPNASIRH